MFLRNSFLPFYIAYKYARSGCSGSFIKFVSRLTFISIIISSFALCITMVIMSGFEIEIYKSLRGVSPDLTISSSQYKIDKEKLENFIYQNFSSQVECLSGTSSNYILFKGDDFFHNLVLKGVQDNYFSKICTLKNYEKLDKSQFLDLDEVVIGSKMADDFDLKLGQVVEFFVPKPERSKIGLKKVLLKVSGIAHTGLEDYDQIIVHSSLDAFNKLFPQEGVDQVLLKVKPSLHKNRNFLEFLNDISPIKFLDKEQELVEKIKKKAPNLQVKSWREGSKPVLDAIKLEKTSLLLILFMILLIAMVNLISLIFMLVQAKKHDIAIFRLMGMQNFQVVKIFIYFGVVVAGVACLVGQGLALGVALFIKNISFLKLPEIYVTQNVPINLDWSIFVLIFGLTILIAFFASLIPGIFVSKMNLAETIKQS